MRLEIGDTTFQQMTIVKMFYISKVILRQNTSYVLVGFECPAVTIFKGAFMELANSIKLLIKHSESICRKDPFFFSTGQILQIRLSGNSPI
jgi:hypothetical protein